MSTNWHTIRLRITTPAFIGGARSRSVDPHQPFRPASVRGVLRTWFRTGVAACLAVDGANQRNGRRDVEDALRQAEGSLFGDAFRTERLASALVLRPTPPGCGGQLRSFPKPERAGLRYLGFGLFEDKWRDAEAVITAGTSEIHLPMRFRPSAPPLAAEALGATIWLWTNLGGIGARSRRGWGSLELLDLGGLPWGGPDVTVRATGVRDAMVRLVEGLDHATEVLRRYLVDNGSRHLVGRGLRHPGVRSLDGIEGVRGLPHTWNSPIDALDATGGLFQDFRSTLARSERGLPPLPDYHAVKDSLGATRRPPRTVDRAAFGLPLPFYFRSLGGAKTQFVPTEGDRLASPMIIRILRVGPAEQWSAALLYLAERSPDGRGGRRHPLAGQSMLQNGRQNDPIPEPDGTIVVDFMEWAMKETHTRYGRPGGNR